MTALLALVPSPPPEAAWHLWLWMAPAVLAGIVVLAAIDRIERRRDGEDDRG